jgi:arylsulfatase A-like enzyme
MSRPAQLPVNRGFDSSLGYLSGAEDHFDQTRDGAVDFWRDHGPAHGENGSPNNTKACQASPGISDTCRFGTYQYAAEAESIIAAHDAASTPLFLYLAFGEVHAPLQAPQKFIDLYPHITYRPRQMCLAMIRCTNPLIH